MLPDKMQHHLVSVFLLTVISWRDAAKSSFSDKGIIADVGGTGIIEYERCGGVGTPVQLRVSDCNVRCSFTPGQVYNFEEDFYPSSAISSLNLWVDMCLRGFCTTLFEAEIPNSSVQPGFLYTAKISVVPNDMMSGNTVEIRANLVHTNSYLVETCLYFQADVV